MSRQAENPVAWRDHVIVVFRFMLSLFDTTMYAIAAFVIAQNDTSLSGGFAVLLIMLTMLYVLMHFYMQPALVLTLNAPCLISLTLCIAGRGVLHSVSIGPTTVLVPAFSAAFTVFFFYGARTQLARARRALVSSRAEAVARAEDAQAASRAKSDFLATMGHEIRTPLNGVLGVAQIMSRGNLTEEQVAQLNIIRDSGKTLLVVLNDLLDFSKIEADKLQLEIAPFSMREVVHDVHATFAAVASAKDLRFVVAIGGKAEGLYEGDSARLRQVLYNLISNAIKFTAVGEVRVEMALEDGAVVIRVSDTGIGVPEDRQRALFEKFVQADNSTTRRYGGTGLGLSIVERLVTMMGGTLRLASVVGEGSTFTVTLPLPRIGDEYDDVPAAETASFGAEVADAPDVRILVAEDNPTNQIVIKLMLSQAGLTPTLVGDGRAAVAAWEAQDWDVVLMDVQMPEMDGLAATTQIRLRESETGRPRTPILALTANAMTHQRLEYLATGMDDVVSKPIDAHALFDTLEKLLSQERTGYVEPRSRAA